MHIASGNKLDIKAPAGGVVKDVPIKYSNLIVVPSYGAAEGQVVSARWRGLFDGPIKAGDTPAFEGEAAYFADHVFTKTKPTLGVKVPVGTFVDGSVLLVGVLV
ncbi:hypothetical protein L4D77_26310 [Photobacterium frigidiphilum]|uniref:capsid cement protein n=1 Tax=Photobacterium frigidiphilum TaxID=264736 RepID=UPI003D0E7BB8